MKTESTPTESRLQLAPGAWIVTDTPQVPGWARVLADYLAPYRPVEKYRPGVVLRSSIDIINELSNMADIDINQAATLMSALGYHVDYSSGAGAWMLQPLDLSLISS